VLLREEVLPNFARQTLTGIAKFTVVTPDNDSEIAGEVIKDPLGFQH
jgi:hypothetical protein